MYLILDPSVPDCLTVYWWSEPAEIWESATVEIGAGIAPSLNTVLTQQGYNIAASQGMGVVVGRGRFTATRLAVVAANTLALALGIGVVTVTTAPSQKPHLLFSNSPRYISATYSSSPRLGVAQAH